MPISTDVVEVPYASLHPDTLRAVVVEFITRAATDYGERERTLEEKITDVMRQLRRGEAKVTPSSAATGDGRAWHFAAHASIKWIDGSPGRTHQGRD